MLPTMLGSFGPLKAANEAYRTAYRKAGHDPASECASGVAYIYVGQDTAEARAFLEPYCDNYGAMVAREFGRHVMNPDIAKLALSKSQRVIDLAFCGDPAEVARGIVAASSAVGGLERMTCMFDMGGVPAENVLASMERFARDVVPLVEREYARKEAA